MSKEPFTIVSEVASIIPYARDKGSLGYVIAPARGKGRTLTASEMSLLLSVYERLLEGEASDD